MTARGFRALAPVAAALGLLAAGCGGGDSPDGPLADALGFLPQEAPLVIAMNTDLRGPQARAAGRILDRFPFSDRLLEGLGESILGDADFEREIRPLLGNEFVVGAPGPRSLLSDSDTEFVGAIAVPDRAALERAVRRGGAKSRGERSGATLYEDSDGDAFAVRDDVLVVAGERGLLEDALARREAGDGLGEDDFDDATKDLGEDALLRAYVDVQGLLEADPGTRAARRVKWVGALRKLGLSAAAAGDRVEVRFRMATEPDGLSDDDLPISPGDGSPPLAGGGGEIRLGIRDPAHIFAFAEGAARAVDPGGFGTYAAGKRVLERGLGIDLEKDLLGQVERDLSIGIDLDGGFAARATVKDRAAFERTLGRLGRAIPSIAERIAGEPVEVRRAGPGRPFDELATRDGRPILAYGLVDGVFVVASDAGRARRIARAAPGRARGAGGAVVAGADAGVLVRKLVGTVELGAAGEVAGRTLARPLGEVTGSVTSSRDGLEGRLSLKVE